LSQQVKVQRELTFEHGRAAIDDNIKGNPSTERMCSVDWFDQTTLDTTNDYTQTLGGVSDAGALEAGGKHGFKGTTGTTDNNVSFLGTALIFDITQTPEIESKIEITDVSGTFVFFGFSDANTESTPSATIDGDGGLTAVATDAAGFVIDADLGTSSIYCASVNDGGTVQYVDTGLDWEDGDSHRLRVKLDSSGNAYFYVDGVQEGYIALAVADVPLCAIWNYGTRADDGANYVYFRYLKKWQDIP
jgi:hypothetical protein